MSWNESNGNVPIESRQCYHGHDEPFLFACVYAIWDFDLTFYRQLGRYSSLVYRYRFLFGICSSHTGIPNETDGGERRGTASCKASPQRSTPMITKSTPSPTRYTLVGVSSTARGVVGQWQPISVKAVGKNRQTGEKSAGASMIRPWRSEHAAEKHRHTTSVMSE
jgi:hypothetical protein